MQYSTQGLLTLTSSPLWYLFPSWRQTPVEWKSKKSYTKRVWNTLEATLPSPGMTPADGKVFLLIPGLLPLTSVSSSLLGCPGINTMFSGGMDILIGLSVSVSVKRGKREERCQCSIVLLVLICSQLKTSRKWYFLKSFIILSFSLSFLFPLLLSFHVSYLQLLKKKLQWKRMKGKTTESLVLDAVDPIHLFL